jgi:uncharacterized protein YdhG (YjbR/CyaY superfamily)
MTNRSTAGTTDEYIAEFPPETRKVLEELRAAIKASAPGATETISYAIPTFDLDGHHLVHFAAFKNHIGFYPTGGGVEAFQEELRAYKRGKGSVQFPLGRPLPLELIRRMVEFRVRESTPIREELTLVLEAAEKRHVVPIDDARLFGMDPAYPSIEELRTLVTSKRPDLEFTVDDDIVRIAPKNPSLP